jgi:hypothetical protein
MRGRGRRSAASLARCGFALGGTLGEISQQTLTWERRFDGLHPGISRFRRDATRLFKGL